MKAFSFLAKVALLCNICFALAIVGRYYPLGNGWQEVKSTIIILGYSAMFINLFVNMAWFIAIAFKKNGVPKWLGVLNFLFLLAQIYVFFIATYPKL
jgi:hypothetical protein